MASKFRNAVIAFLKVCLLIAVSYLSLLHCFVYRKWNSHNNFQSQSKLPSSKDETATAVIYRTETVTVNYSKDQIKSLKDAIAQLSSSANSNSVNAIQKQRQMLEAQLENAINNLKQR